MFAIKLMFVLCLINSARSLDCKEKVHPKKNCTIYEILPENLYCSFKTVYSSEFKFYFKPASDFDEITVELKNSFLPFLPSGTAQITTRNLKYPDGWNKITLEETKSGIYNIIVEDKIEIHFQKSIGLSVGKVVLSITGSGSWSGSLCHFEDLEQPKNLIEENTIAISGDASRVTLVTEQTDSSEVECAETIFAAGMIMIFISLLVLTIAALVLRRKYSTKTIVEPEYDEESNLDYIANKKNLQLDLEGKSSIVDDHIYEELSHFKHLENKVEVDVDDSPRYVELPIRNPMLTPKSNEHSIITPWKQ